MVAMHCVRKLLIDYQGVENLQTIQLGKNWPVDHRKRNFQFFE